MTDVKKPWKPNTYIACPECENILFISSIIDLNGQVNFACNNDECAIFGFCHNGKLYFNEG